MRSPGGTICRGKAIFAKGSAYRVWVSRDHAAADAGEPRSFRTSSASCSAFPDVRCAGGCAGGRSAASVDRPRLLRACAQPASRRAAHSRRATAGYFLRSLEAVMELPGIGRSTAGAILAISAGARHSILDGNVKRVLARYYAVDGAPDEAATLAQLWQLADDNTPANGRGDLHAGHHGSRRDAVHARQAALRRNARSPPIAARASKAARANCPRRSASAPRASGRPR